MHTKKIPIAPQNFFAHVKLVKTTLYVHVQGYEWNTYSYYTLFFVCNYSYSNRLQLQIIGALTMQSKERNQNSVHCQQNGKNQEYFGVIKPFRTTFLVPSKFMNAIRCEYKGERGPRIHMPHINCNFSWIWLVRREGLVRVAEWVWQRARRLSSWVWVGQDSVLAWRRCAFQGRGRRSGRHSLSE